MYILLSIDDTDSIESRGTGELADILAKDIETLYWGKSSKITRHQLLLHQDIPYTSHNSSMCFKAEIKENHLQELIEYASVFLADESEKGSDPGLCIAVVDRLSDKKKLIDFGFRAKKHIVTKEEAYGLASELGIHLSEHGGTGQGVIGALAGAGLRLSGNDGLFKGKYIIQSPNQLIKVSELCSYGTIEKVRSTSGEILDGKQLIRIGKMVKTALIEDAEVVLVEEADENEGQVKWKACSKKELVNR